MATSFQGNVIAIYYWAPSRFLSSSTLEPRHPAKDTQQKNLKRWQNTYNHWTAGEGLNTNSVNFTLLLQSLVITVKKTTTYLNSSLRAGTHATLKGISSQFKSDVGANSFRKPIYFLFCFGGFCYFLKVNAVLDRFWLNNLRATATCTDGTFDSKSFPILGFGHARENTQKHN